MKNKTIPRKLKKFLIENNALEKFIANIYDEERNGLFYDKNWDKYHTQYRPLCIGSAFKWNNEGEYWADLDDKFNALQNTE